tara:strand:+ start:169 stop:366 length:198 start_codon:yes stop_codon:yes gene_type:complete
MIFKCNECNKTKEVYKTTTKFIDGKWIQDVKCECGKYMNQVMTEEHSGMPTIIRNELGFRKTTLN